MMVQFTATLKKFDSQGEKTGWTYIEVPAAVADKLKPGNKKPFRVKGKLDSLKIDKVALMPMGDGDFIMPVNAAMRKGIKKQKGANVKVQLEADDEPLKPPSEFIECLSDEPKALEHYNNLTYGHKNYFTKWIESAKTDETKAKRIAQAVNALAKGLHFGEMLRARKEDRAKLL